MKYKIRYIIEIFLIISGLVIVIDSLFLHLISFDYGSLVFLNSYINHWMIGVILIAIALISSGISKTKYIIWSTILIIAIGFLLTPVPLCYIREASLPVNATAECNVSHVTELQKKSSINILSLGWSMYPTLSENMICNCIKKDSYYVGDIVFFHVKINDYYLGITHRIVRIKDDRYITKGDNNLVEDEFSIGKDDIICSIPQVPRFLV